MNTIKNTSKDIGAKKLSLRDELNKYLKYWPWFILSIIIAVVAGYLFIRYSTPIYNASATIIINEENSKSSGSEMSAFANLGFISGLNTNSLEKEMAILKSRRLMKDVVKALNINVRYFIPGNIREVEIYNDHPFIIKILKVDDDKIKDMGGAQYSISPLANGIFYRY